MRGRDFIMILALGVFFGFLAGLVFGMWLQNWYILNHLSEFGLIHG